MRSSSSALGAALAIAALGMGVGGMGASVSGNSLQTTFPDSAFRMGRRLRPQKVKHLAGDKLARKATEGRIGLGHPR